MENNLILELIKFEIKKKKITKDSVIEKFEKASNRNDINRNFINISLDVSGFDEELIMNELVILQEHNRKRIKFDDGWESVSGFIHSFLLNETDKLVSISVPLPHIIKLLENIKKSN
ncbi:hypothetical protein [Flavobacterium degerlachei]|jgi:hypothetical protein|uniref:Uncharacterized protein n=1 Tax=Flavobacterium degerlachei TaxID=229203 RepID=A0A1H3GRI3_9FLAO|nr:hypothetical protein [Flavobacterium degerlachei]SDY05248.1 hypothetical protein SAMN05444338_1261 [Flavobacterium degerlachei]